MLQNAGVSFAEKVAFSGIMIIFSVILTAMLGFFIGIPLGPYSLLLPLAVLLSSPFCAIGNYFTQYCCTPAY